MNLIGAIVLPAGCIAAGWIGMSAVTGATYPRERFTLTDAVDLCWRGYHHQANQPVLARPQLDECTRLQAELDHTRRK